MNDPDVLFDWDAFYKIPKGKARSKVYIWYCANLATPDLLDFVCDMSSGDDDDGVFTELGRYEYKMCKYILLRRIRKLEQSREQK